MSMEMRIRFQGKEYLLIGSLRDGGPIATKEQYENFEMSYAHLRPDGVVMRFRDSIGHRDEIEVLGEVEAKPDIGKAIEMMLTPGMGGWPT